MAEAESAGHQQPLKVYLRIRPFFQDEISDNEDQGCVVLENGQTVSLHAPKGSSTMKNSDKGIGQAIHKFTFSQIFGPESKQTEIFEGTIKDQVYHYLEGKNALIFSYGVTNAGKTHTIQGTQIDPGILPQSLNVIFQHIIGRQYEDLDLKPYLNNDVQNLCPDQVKQEINDKAAIFALLKEESEPLRVRVGSSDSCAYSTASLDSSSGGNSLTADLANTPERDDCQFALWVAFYEIYNENIFDLLQPPSSRNKKRTALRVCEDSVGNSYVRDLKWINVQNSEEARKILRVGNKNRSAASTKINQSSSRSHSIFTMKLLKMYGTEVQTVSELSLCDLAGSERCNKTKTFGERLKEAGNINTSLLILGKCIAAMQNRQSDRVKTSYIPFRESKLTRLFQSFLCGKGKTSMIVNINQCASTYDETLHVMKFSAVAKQVVQVIPTKSLESLAPRLVGWDGKLLLKNGVIDNQALESYLSEDELLDEEEEADVSILPQEELMNVIENLRTKLLAERKKNLIQEIEIRNEMGDAMLQQLMEGEELQNRQMAEMKESYQEKMENTFEMYKDALKEHAYQCALARVEDDYVPLAVLFAEQDKVEELNHKMAEMENKLAATRMVPSCVSTQDDSCQTLDPSQLNVQMDSERCKVLCEEKSSIEKLCEEKEQLISVLQKKLMELNETFQEALANSATLQKKLEEQDHHLDGIRKENMEKDEEVAFLKAELAKPSKKSPIRTRRGLLANIKDAVTSPRKSTVCKTLRKSSRTTSLLKKPSQ
ncbi:kinesin-like protein KIF20A [Osmerus mordax]|uniref:kinesin-like protein KIF20A n=1 Tax=Osmerus mordax TaxID=8014 RepID=UPI0035105CB0